MKNAIDMGNQTVKKYKTDFVEIAVIANPIFNKENLTLSFDGYSDTLVDYLNCPDYDVDKLEVLIGDLNAWGCYMGDLKALTEQLQLKYENKKMYIQAFPKIPANENNIKIINAQIVILKLFFKHLNIQCKMFNSLSKHCTRMYNSACENLLYRY